MNLPVREQDGVVWFAVKAVPGASRDRIVGVHGDALKVQVSAPPQGGRANERLCELLAAALGVAARDVVLTRGHGSPHKVVTVRGLDADTVRTRLAATS